MVCLGHSKSHRAALCQPALHIAGAGKIPLRSSNYSGGAPAPPQKDSTKALSLDAESHTIGNRSRLTQLCEG
jgi:hypothetical protein